MSGDMGNSVGAAFGKRHVLAKAGRDTGLRCQNATKQRSRARFPLHRNGLDVEDRGSDPQAGFTIVELLVSLTILTLILAFIPGTLRIGQRVWEVDQTFERREALSTFRRYVEQRLAEAMPIYLRDRAAELRIEFAGEPGRLAFVAPAVAGPAGGGVYRFELTREAGARGRQPLILRQSLYRIPEAGQGRNEGSSLAQTATAEQRSRAGVAGLAFRYFGAPDPQKAAQWQSQWPRRDSLPDLVEISLITGDRTPKVERTIVQLRLGSSR
jgi:general secretion pathway protein J